MRKPRFTIRELMLSVGLIAMSLWPIAMTLNGAFEFWPLIVLSPALFGAGVGTLVQSKWSGFNWGLGFLIALVTVAYLFAQASAH